MECFTICLDTTWLLCIHVCDRMTFDNRKLDHYSMGIVHNFLDTCQSLGNTFSTNTLVVEILLLHSRTDVKKWNLFSSHVTTLEKRTLPFIGNIFSNFRAHVTSSFIWSDVTKYDTHLAVICLIFKRFSWIVLTNPFDVPMIFASIWVSQSLAFCQWYINNIT